MKRFFDSLKRAETHGILSEKVKIESRQTKPIALDYALPSSLRSVGHFNVRIPTSAHPTTYVAEKG